MSQPEPPPSADSALQAAAGHVAAGRFAQAEAVYRRVLDENPNHPQALHGFGLLALRAGRADVAVDCLSRAAAVLPEVRVECDLGTAWVKLGDFHKAIECYHRAIALNAARPEPHAALGAVLSRLNHTEEAVASLQRAIDLGLDQAHLHHHLSSALLRLGRRAEAEAAARKALARAPQSAEIWQALGEAIGEQRRLEEAIDCFRKVISLKPGWAVPHCALGISLRRGGRLDEAAEALRQAVRLQPMFVEALSHLGFVLAGQNKLEEAIPLLDRAVKFRPQDVDTRIELARALELAQRRKEAGEILSEGLKLAPNDPHVRFMIAAFGGRNAPPVMPPSLVRVLFDDYSESFDEHLDKSEYRVPQQLKEALAAAGAGENLDILDLGCGTGMCGQLLRPMAGKMAGVDLSPAMIERSRQRGVYDHLELGEIVELLRRTAGAYDVLVAGDVLIYIGDVADLFRAAHSALRAGGMLAFSIESCETPGWVLRPTRRYAHNPDYIRRTATDAGLEVILEGPITVRKEGGKDVPGLIVILRRTQSGS